MSDVENALPKPSGNAKKMIEQHHLWLSSGGLRGSRLQSGRRILNFSNLDLTGVNLSLAELNSANFSGSTLCKAAFMGAALSSANFIRADLRGANFGGADVILAVFRDAQMDGAVFDRADTRATFWSEADCDALKRALLKPVADSRRDTRRRVAGGISPRL